MGYQAAMNAGREHPKEGRAGVGRGATVGKVLGPAHCMKGGVGTCCEKIGEDIYLGALVVVNAFGDVVDPGNSEIIAGAKTASGEFLNSEKYLKENQVQPFQPPTNTTLGVVATNAKLTK